MKKMSFWLKTAIFVVSSIILSSCGKTENNMENSLASDGKIKVLCSFCPVYDFTKKIAGDKADIDVLIPLSSEPHSYEATPLDIRKFQDADIFIYNGAGLEYGLMDIMNAQDEEKPIRLDLSKGIDLIPSDGHECHHHHHEHGEECDHHEHGEECDHHHEHGEECDHHEHGEECDHHEHGEECDHHEHGEECDHHHEHGEECDHHHEHGEECDHHEHSNSGYDPHIWLDPLNVIIEMESIKNALSEIDEKNASYYQENFEKNKAKLLELDSEYRKLADNGGIKDIIVSHSAFGYLCREYGMNQISIEGLEPSVEPDPKNIKEIVNLARDKGINTVFYEEYNSKKTAEVIASEIGGSIDVLSPYGFVGEEEYKSGRDYFSIMHDNLDALRKASNNGQ